MDEDGIPPEEFGYAAISAAVTALAAVINLVTIVVIIASKSLRLKKRYVFIFNLALADATASAVLFTQHLPVLTGVEFPRTWWREPLFNAALLISIMSTLSIAVQRYISVRFDPLGQRKLVTAGRSIAGCLAIWVIFLSAYLLVAWYLDYYFIGFVITPAIAIPALLVTTVCYAYLYRLVSANLKAIPGGDTDTLLRKRTTSHKTMLSTFLLVIFTTTVCWVPMCIVLLVEYYGPESLFETEWFGAISLTCFFLIALSGLINPLIYWFGLPELRRKLTCCCCRQDNDADFDSDVSIRAAACGDLDLTKIDDVKVA